MRDRKYRLLLYPEDASHKAAIETLQAGGYTFAAILHDKDVHADGDEKGQLIKPHWHVVVKFKNARWSNAFCKELGIKENYCLECLALDEALLYLIHYNQPEKHQYELDEVFGPLQPKLAALLSDTDEGTRALHLVDIVESSPGLMGYTELIKRAVAAGLYSDLRRMGHLATCLVREHNFQVTNDLKYVSDMRSSRERFDDFLERSDSIPFATRVDALSRQNMMDINIKPLEDKPNE